VEISHALFTNNRWLISPYKCGCWLLVLASKPLYAFIIGGSTSLVESALLGFHQQYLEIYGQQEIKNHGNIIAGWWYTYPSEK